MQQKPISQGWRILIALVVGGFAGMGGYALNSSYRTEKAPVPPLAQTVLSAALLTGAGAVTYMLLGRVKVSGEPEVPESGVQPVQPYVQALQPVVPAQVTLTINPQSVQMVEQIVNNAMRRQALPSAQMLQDEFEVEPSAVELQSVDVSPSLPLPEPARMPLPAPTTSGASSNGSSSNELPMPSVLDQDDLWEDKDK